MSVDGATARDPTDSRLDALAGVVARVGTTACWLARLATRAAGLGGIAGAVLWWAVAGDRVDEWWQGTLASLLALAFCLAAPVWLLNVRFALLDLVELPEKLSGVTTRRLAQLRRSRRPVERPEGGVLGGVRAVRDVVRDYGDVAGSWGTVAQLVVPTFWVLTLVALVAVPVLVLAALVAASISG